MVRIEPDGKAFLDDTDPPEALTPEGAVLQSYHSEPDCVFCERLKALEFDGGNDHAVEFEPLDPMAPSHRVVISRHHVADAVAFPEVTAQTMRFAAEVAMSAGSCNLITSVGMAATQTVYHLHIHVVPRRTGDGLALPWTRP